LFVNVVVIRVDTAGEPTYRELLRRVRDTALSALSHQEP
jgi:non-ribosomal peptide synthetase component F